MDRAQNGDLSVEEKVARCIAPIKPEYVLSKTQLEGKTAQPDSTPAAAAAAAPPAAEVQPKQSKRQQKKEHKARKPVCHNFLGGRCVYGSGCRFVHDLEGFVKSKGPDLPGRCPFSSMETCPYGVGCRFLKAHTGQDALQEQAKELARASAQKEQEGGAAPGVPVPGSVEVPAASSIQPELNTLDKNVQHLLWKNRYDFTKADGILRSMGLKITFRQPKQVKSEKNGGQGKERTPAPPQQEQEEQHKQQQQGGIAECRQQQEATQHQGQGEMQVDEQPPTSSNGQHTEGKAAGQANSRMAGPGLSSEEIAPDQGQQGGQDKQDEPAWKKARLDSREGLVSAPALLSNPAAAAVPEAANAGTCSKVEERSMHVETPLRHGEKKVVDFRDKTILAPLTTVGNLPFRRICKSFGADVTVGEMALATNLLQGQASEWALLKRHPSEDVFGVQLAGGYPDSVARTCQLISETCPAVDFVDLNCGCPIDIVCDRGAGSALLLRPKKLAEICQAADRAMSMPLTIKTRKGYYDDADITHTFVEDIRSWGPIALTLHGRTRQQRYSKLADWQYISRCAETAAPSKLQLIGNGDVLSYTDWNEHMRVGEDGAASPLASCMIGRGALIKPWLFQEIKEQRHIDISASERLDILRSYCSAGLEHWGSDTRGVETTRKFLLEWLSYLNRYIPVGLMEVLPQRLNWRSPAFFGRNELESLFASENPQDWIRISEMLLGKAPGGFTFTPKHKSNSFTVPPATTEKPASRTGSAPAGTGYEQDDIAEG